MSNNLLKQYIINYLTYGQITTGYLSGKKLSDSNKRSRQVITTKFINKHIYDNLTYQIRRWQFWKNLLHRLQYKWLMREYMEDWPVVIVLGLRVPAPAQLKLEMNPGGTRIHSMSWSRDNPLRFRHVRCTVRIRDDKTTWVEVQEESFLSRLSWKGWPS